MSKLIRVLVVDDSAFVRKVVTEMLSRSPFIEVVATARDGEEALELAERHQPDVVTLDLMMPGIDGVQFLQRQMARRPTAVVVCSIAHESGELAMRAFDAGAVEFVQKPTALATERIFELADELVAKVKAAAGVEISRLAPGGHSEPEPATRTVKASAGTSRAVSGARRADVVVIGVSTGGPQALRQLVPALPADFPVAIAIVLHMPVGYTQVYAQRLNEASALEVVEARDGDLIRPGVAYLAPAGHHLSFARRPDGTVRAHLDLRPIDAQHRPSVDVLFRSAAEVYGDRVLGLVMTGMGSDGVLGAAHIKAQGGRILTEAESSCIVYGMPRSVDDAGLSDRSAALPELSAALMDMI